MKIPILAGALLGALIAVFFDPCGRPGGAIAEAAQLEKNAADKFDQAPQPDALQLQTGIETFWQARNLKKKRADLPARPRWHVTEVLGCLPAFDEKRGKPWRNHWLCVARTNDPQGFVVSALVRTEGNGWSVIDLDGNPACAPLREAETALRRITGDARLKVRGDMDKGQGLLTNTRPTGSGEDYPWRIRRYETVLGTYLTYIWHENGEYVFDAGDMANVDLSMSRFIRQDQPSAAHLEAVRQARDAALASAMAKTAPPKHWSVAGELVKPDEAARRFDLKNRLLAFDGKGTAPVRVVEGDLRIDGNLLLDWKKFSAAGLIVTGDLMVSGSIINANANYGPFLLVGGRTRAHAIVGGGAQLMFEGEAQVTDIVIGHYNDGSLVFKSNLSAPVVVTEDHYLEIRGKLDGRWFDTFNGGDSWTQFLDMRPPELAGMKEVNWDGLQDYLITALKARRSVLRPDLPPKK